MVLRRPQLRAIYNHAEFAGSQGGVGSTQHLPGASPLSQKRLFKETKVCSGAKARDSKEKDVRCTLTQVKRAVALTVDVPSIGTKKVHGS